MLAFALLFVAAEATALRFDVEEAKNRPVTKVSAGFQVHTAIQLD